MNNLVAGADDRGNLMDEGEKFVGGNRTATSFTSGLARKQHHSFCCLRVDKGWIYVFYLKGYFNLSRTLTVALQIY